MPGVRSLILGRSGRSFHASVSGLHSLEARRGATGAKTALSKPKITRTAGIVARVDQLRRRVVVSGKVQNVWFRDSCRAEALARDVVGWVRNCPDGSVEAVLQGTPQAVEEMISWCRLGPPRARVDKVEVREEPVGNEVGFSVI